MSTSLPYRSGTTHALTILGMAPKTAGIADHLTNAGLGAVAGAALAPGGKEGKGMLAGAALGVGGGHLAGKLLKGHRALTSKGKLENIADIANKATKKAKG